MHFGICIFGDCGLLQFESSDIQLVTSQSFVLSVDW